MIIRHQNSRSLSLARRRIGHRSGEPGWRAEQGNFRIPRQNSLPAENQRASDRAIQLSEILFTLRRGTIFLYQERWSSEPKRPGTGKKAWMERRSPARSNKLSATAPRVWDSRALKDGKYLRWSSQGGSDWNDVYIWTPRRSSCRRITSMDEEFSISWQGSGFYYSRYPAPEQRSRANRQDENHQVYYQRSGYAAIRRPRWSTKTHEPPAFHTCGQRR